jgi:acid phosphatase
MHAIRRSAGLLLAVAGLTVATSAQTPPPAATTAKTTKPAKATPTAKPPAHTPPRPDLSSIETVVVIFAENRAFDTLYGTFPGANGLRGVQASRYTQRDRDGSVLKTLPPIWTGLTAQGVTPAITETQTERLPNAPFGIDDRQGFNASASIATRDLWHRFYQNQMQIHAGANDRFVAFADSGALPMGHYDGSKLAMWKVAREFTLADNFFMGAFGGSYLNHIYLVCACIPVYPEADQSPARALISAVEPDGVTLTLAPSSPPSAIDGPPVFVQDGNMTPDFYAVNTMQPPYQPSLNVPPANGDAAFADPANPTTLPPQKLQTIGDLLSEKGVSWAWYGGAWQATLDGPMTRPVPNFQTHHAPFNYFAAFAPGTRARADHLRDGGLAGVEFIKAIDTGGLPQVSFYKPQGNLNEHPGYTDVRSGDLHIADVVAHLRKSPQWRHMLVIVTYDENGGQWDHVAPPKGDRWGPGTRIPAIIISPFARRGFVDHSLYDTSSILRFVTKRFDLPMLAGLSTRDAAFAANGAPPPGDLTGALKLPVKQPVKQPVKR